MISEGSNSQLGVPQMCSGALVVEEDFTTEVSPEGPAMAPGLPCLTWPGPASGLRQGAAVDVILSLPNQTLRSFANLLIGVRSRVFAHLNAHLL
jgi:hypothetical protein